VPLCVCQGALEHCPCHRILSGALLRR
jgi:hypothetical protein